MDEIVDNIEFRPIVVGAIISVVLILLFPMGVMHLFWVMIGAAVSSFLTDKPTKYALIYGAVIGIISSFFMITIYTIPLYIILGVFGAFVGKIIQANLK